LSDHKIFKWFAIPNLIAILCLNAARKQQGTLSLSLASVLQSKTGIESDSGLRIYYTKWFTTSEPLIKTWTICKYVNVLKLFKKLTVTHRIENKIKGLKIVNN